MKSAESISRLDSLTLLGWVSAGQTVPVLMLLAVRSWSVNFTVLPWKVICKCLASGRRTGRRLASLFCVILLFYNIMFMRIADGNWSEN
jgi:hypothetical protein